MARTKRGKRTLADVVDEQGRKWSWLAKQTGYTEEHIAAVALRGAPSSTRFHLAMEHALGTTYDWPKGVKRQNGEV